MADETFVPKEDALDLNMLHKLDELLIDPTTSDDPVAPLDVPLIAEIWSQPSEQEPLPEIPPLEQPEPPSK